MIEMEMRNNYILDVSRLVAVQLDLLIDDLLRGEPDVAQELGRGTPVALRVGRDFGGASGVEQHQAFGVLDEEGRDRDVDDLVAAAHHQVSFLHAEGCALERNKPFRRRLGHAVTLRMLRSFTTAGAILHRPYFKRQGRRRYALPR